MTRIARLASDLGRLVRESEMLETVITMMSDDRLAGPAADGTPRVEVIGLSLIHI